MSTATAATHDWFVDVREVKILKEDKNGKVIGCSHVLVRRVVLDLLEGVVIPKVDTTLPMPRHARLTVTHRNGNTTHSLTHRKLYVPAGGTEVREAEEYTPLLTGLTSDHAIQLLMNLLGKDRWDAERILNLAETLPPGR